MYHKVNYGFWAFFKISSQKPDFAVLDPCLRSVPQSRQLGTARNSRCDKNVIGPCSNSTKTVQIESSHDLRKCLTVQI
jgi:hypothetical protein